MLQGECPNPNEHTRGPGFARKRELTANDGSRPSRSSLLTSRA
jgi:hypothetical protein